MHANDDRIVCWWSFDVFFLTAIEDNEGIDE